jgi:hypothetical protein
MGHVSKSDVSRKTPRAARVRQIKALVKEHAGNLDGVAAGLGGLSKERARQLIEKAGLTGLARELRAKVTADRQAAAVEARTPMHAGKCSICRARFLRPGKRVKLTCSRRCSQEHKRRRAAERVRVWYRENKAEVLQKAAAAYVAKNPGAKPRGSRVLPSVKP